MRATTPLLGSLSLGLQATPEPGDTELTIPPVMVPLAELPFACLPKSQPAPGSVNYDVWNESGMTSLYESLAAAAGLSVTRVLHLGPGLWELRIGWNIMLANTATSALSLAGSYGNPDIGLFTATIFAYDGYLGSNMVSGEWVHRLMIPTGNIFRADLNHDNTAGTSATVAALSIRANRLL